MEGPFVTEARYLQQQLHEQQDRKTIKMLVEDLLDRINDRLAEGHNSDAAKAKAFIRQRFVSPLQIDIRRFE